nr:hypothetical protein [Streptomyces sp. DvalAA-43]
MPEPRHRTHADHHHHRRRRPAPVHPLRHRHRQPGTWPVPQSRLPGPGPAGALPQRSHAVRGHGSPAPTAPQGLRAGTTDFRPPAPPG